MELENISTSMACPRAQKRTQCLKSLLHSSQESFRKPVASIFIQSQCSKAYLNEMQALAARLRVGFAMSGKRPLGSHKVTSPAEAKLV